jgi:hypothetical protein
LVSDLFLVVAMGSAPTLLGKRFRYYSYATIAILIAAGAVTSRQIPQLSQGQSTPWMGVEERVNIYATMLWVAVTAIAVWRAKGSRAPGPLGKPTVTSQRMQRVSQ